MTLPITRQQAMSAVTWMKGEFRAEMNSAVSGSVFTIDHLCGIACQETAYFWLNFINQIPRDQVLARCVLDASGDYPGTKRSPFPKNTAAFRAAYDVSDPGFADMLIDEANQTRALRGFGPQTWVYKGYGIYQYDLQFVRNDQDFFQSRLWYDFNECIARVMSELNDAYNRKGDVWQAIKSYNGSGPAATEYANNVIQYTSYSTMVP